MRLSKIAGISITETDSMDVLEEKELINLLAQELNPDMQSIGSVPDADEHTQGNH